MKKRRINRWTACTCCLLALLCAGCAAIPAMQPAVSPSAMVDADIRENAVYEVVANEFITLRETPELGARELARLPVGARMVCLDYEGIFMKVRVEQSGAVGYVHGGYVRRADAHASSSQSAIVPNDGADYTYARMKQDLPALQAAYPGLLETVTVAQTADGRDVVLCIVGDAQAAHKILITGAIHGREHMTALLLMKLMERYLSSMRSGQAGPYEDVAFYIIPMLNPDGVTISQMGASGIRDQALRAKVEGILQSENMPAALWKSNANGVDLNRNFPTGWESLYHKGPSATRYRGASPLCEVETQAIETLINTVDFDVTVSYHAMGSLQYWQYGQDGTLLEETRALAEAVYAVTKYPLATAQAEEDLEGGGLRDWALMDVGIPSVTVEIGCLDAPLQQQEWAAIYQRNAGVLEALAAFVINGQ